MNSKSHSSAVLIYLGVIATSLGALAVASTAIVKASSGIPEVSAREKTVLELQVESSREIRRALATPVAQPPSLTPITARPARDVRTATLTAKPARAKPSQEAMNAMAMDQSGSYSSRSMEFSAQNYSIRDRHTSF